MLWAMSWLLCTALSVLCFHFNHDDFIKVLFKQVSTSGGQGVCSLQFILTVPHCNNKISEINKVCFQLFLSSFDSVWVLCVCIRMPVQSFSDTMARLMTKVVILLRNVCWNISE